MAKKSKAHVVATTPSLDRFLSVNEVIDHLSLGRSKVYELIASGDIQSARFGRARRVPLSSLIEFTQRSMVGPR